MYVAGLHVIWTALDVTSAQVILNRSIPLFIPLTELERESDSLASEVLSSKTPTQGIRKDPFQ